MHEGNGPGVSNYGLGEKGGTATNSLTLANLPAHNHTVHAIDTEGDSASPTNNFPANTKLLNKEYIGSGNMTTMHPNMIGNAGGNQPVNNMQPYQTITFIIAVEGIFPPRD